MNVWRSTAQGSVAVETQPLAVLDCSSVLDEDLFTVELVFTDRIGQNLGVDGSAAHHRWYHYSSMAPEECLLFKAFDNTTDDAITGRFALHSSFDHPGTTDSSPPRESIECRLLAIYPKDEERESQSKL